MRWRLGSRPHTQGVACCQRPAWTPRPKGQGRTRMRSGPSLPTWEEEGCGGILAGEALPRFVWSVGPPCWMSETPLRGRFPPSAASGSSSGRSSLRRNRIQVARDSGTVRWGPRRDWEAGGSWGQGQAAGFSWGPYCSLRVPILSPSFLPPPTF